MMQTTVPSEHQKLGRQAKGFDRQKWDERQSFRTLISLVWCNADYLCADKSRIVQEGNYHKFTKAKDSARIAKMLLDTGDRELVEVYNSGVVMVQGHLLTCTVQSSPTDRIWGVGFSAADAEQHRGEWGENRLGKALMSVRERLRRESQ